MGGGGGVDQTGVSVVPAREVRPAAALVSACAEDVTSSDTDDLPGLRTG